MVQIEKTVGDRALAGDIGDFRKERCVPWEYNRIKRVCLGGGILSFEDHKMYFEFYEFRGKTLRNLKPCYS